MLIDFRHFYWSIFQHRPKRTPLVFHIEIILIEVFVILLDEFVEHQDQFVQLEVQWLSHKLVNCKFGGQLITPIFQIIDDQGQGCRQQNIIKICQQTKCQQISNHLQKIPVQSSNILNAKNECPHRPHWKTKTGGYNNHFTHITNLPILIKIFHKDSLPQAYPKQRRNLYPSLYWRLVQFHSLYWCWRCESEQLCSRWGSLDLLRQLGWWRLFYWLGWLTRKGWQEGTGLLGVRCLLVGGCFGKGFGSWGSQGWRDSSVWRGQRDLESTKRQEPKERRCFYPKQYYHCMVALHMADKSKLHQPLCWVDIQQTIQQLLHPSPYSKCQSNLHHIRYYHCAGIPVQPICPTRSSNTNSLSNTSIIINTSGVFENVKDSFHDGCLPAL